MVFCRITGIVFLLLLSAAETAGSHPSPGTAAASSAAEERRDSQLQKVKQWWTEVSQHEPGKPDGPATTIGGWPSYDLETVIQFLVKNTSPGGSSKRASIKAPVRRALGMTELEAKQGDVSRIVKKGALLHTDIALMELAMLLSE